MRLYRRKDDGRYPSALARDGRKRDQHPRPKVPVLVNLYEKVGEQLRNVDGSDERAVAEDVSAGAVVKRGMLEVLIDDPTGPSGPFCFLSGGSLYPEKKKKKKKKKTKTQKTLFFFFFLLHDTVIL